jgi:iron(II)-dependent oxidoreductase
MSVDQLADWIDDARCRTFAFIEDLNDRQLMGEPHPIVNPLLWEAGHVAWFQEYWVLRDGGRLPSIRPDADALFDSGKVAHDTRWNLPLPSRRDVIRYLDEIRLRSLDALNDKNKSVYYQALSVFHEDMHLESFTFTRQLLGYPRPAGAPATSSTPTPAAPNSDIDFPAGRYTIGASSDEPFVFDNEKWAHPVTLESFSIARLPVTQAEFAAFVDDNGYQNPGLWCDPGWRWLQTERAEHPIYWRRDGHGWLRRHFSDWVPLEPGQPVRCVNWFEASAWCRWAGRRLPTEAEWEAAAACSSDDSDGNGNTLKRRFPWGDDAPGRDRGNLDWRHMDCIDVSALPDGDTPAGCRQMLGNVWEWTASDFTPYAGFVPDPYRDYSLPWFGTHKVLRGGSWATTGRLLRNTWRNFFLPQRRDIFAGFRTCAT